MRKVFATAVLAGALCYAPAVESAIAGTSISCSSAQARDAKNGAQLALHCETACTKRSEVNDSHDRHACAPQSGASDRHPHLHGSTALQKSYIGDTEKNLKTATPAGTGAPK